MRIEYHRTLLADRVRNAAFHEALRRVIVKGKTTVADIGAGTGFLGFLASKLGAKRVDFYERADIADVARKLLRHNRLTNCRIAEIHSTDVATPDRVDVVVSETLGNYPFEENIVETFNDARARFLNPGGILIPRAVEQFVCPVTAERFLSELSTWDDVGFGLDFAPAKAMTLNNIYVRLFKPRRSPGQRRRSAVLGQARLRPPQQDDALRRGELASQEAHHRLRPRPVVVGGAGRRRVAGDGAAQSANALGAALPAGLGADHD